MAFCAEQEPLNCAWFWRIGLRGDLADNSGTITELPGRTGEMSTDLSTMYVEEVCLWRLECPVEAARLGFTCVNLNAVCHGLEQHRGSLRGCDGRLVSFSDKGAFADQYARHHN